MKLDFFTSEGRLRELHRRAADARRSEFDGIVLAEAGRNALLACAAVALSEPELDLGTGVAVAFARSPMVTATAAWQLAEATGGRFHLGLGTQVEAHVTRRFSAPFSPPGPRMKEYVLALRAIFRAFQGEERLAFDGRYYQFSLLPTAWSPGPIEHPHVPIYVAAVGPWMVRMAGEVADGVHVHPLHSVRYLREVLAVNLEEGARKAGRSASDVKLAVPVFTIVGDTPEERAPWKQIARSQAAFYGSTKAYAHQFELLGYGELSARLNERLKAGDPAGAADLITDEMLEHFAITATWDELADRIVERYAGIADRLLVYFAEQMCARDPSMWDRWRDVARAVSAPTRT